MTHSPIVELCKGQRATIVVCRHRWDTQCVPLYPDIANMTAQTDLTCWIQEIYGCNRTDFKSGDKEKLKTQTCLFASGLTEIREYVS